MKKSCLILIAFCIPTMLLAQLKEVRGVVKDAESGEPLPFVNITLNQSRIGTASDIDGKFLIQSDLPIESLQFSFVGYHKKVVDLTNHNKKTLTIELKQQKYLLQEVVITPGENPAHRIIRKVIANKDLNNPEKLSSFTYTSYNKMYLTIDVDSLDGRIDTVRTNPNPENPEGFYLDSGNYEVKNFFNKQYLFMMESVSERKFLYPRKNNEKVIASRVSGLKDPSFALLATQFQSFFFL